MAKKQRSNSLKIGFWTMMRDVLVASMNKGQFPLALVGFIFIIMILKMPSEDVSKLMFAILDGVSAGYYLGYLLSFILLSSWFIHTRWQRRIITSEMARVTEERNRLQSDQVDGTIQSSGE